MQYAIVIAGFGGQGALFAGQALAYAAMQAGRHVTWLPAYGPEMRGGTAHCTVIIADEPIGSAQVRNPNAVIAMNQPSLAKYAARVAAGGVLVVNTFAGQPLPECPGVRVVPIAANLEAEALGFLGAANLVLVGALLAVEPLLPLEAVEQALSARLAEHHPERLAINCRALRRGAALAAAVQTVQPEAA